MRRHAGQAMRGVFRRARQVLSLGFALVLALTLAVLALSWRLASGPIALPWLVRQLEAAANTDPAGPRWSIGAAELAWEGFGNGLDRPLDIRITDVAVASAAGRVLARLPEARVSLAARELLRLRLIPSAIELRGAELRARRSAADGITVELPSGENPAGGPDAAPAPASTVEDLIAALLRPPEDGRLSQLRRVVVREAHLVLDDTGSATTWNATNLTLDLRRGAGGGVDGTATLDVPLGSQTLHLDLRAALRDQAETLTLNIRAEPLNPAQLARDLPVLAAAAPLDAAVSAELLLVLGRGLDLRRGEARLRLGPGRVEVVRGSLPIAGASATLRGDFTAISLTDLLVDVATPSGAPSRIAVSGGVEIAANGYDAALAVTLDQIGAADLGAVWPDGVAGPGTKVWVARNITDGTAHDLHAAIGLHVPPDLSDVQVTRITGGLSAEGLTVHWLQPVPPVEQAQAELSFVSPDIIDVTLAAGVQGGLKLTGGLVRLSGLAQRDQVADIAVDLAGPLPDVLAVLRHPRLRLLDRRPIEMRDPAGEVRGRVEIAALPLDSRITVEDVHLRGTAKLTGVHLGAIAAGRDLDDGVLELTATNDGLKAGGTARLAGIAAKLAVDMDFRAGAPTQIVQSVTVAASPEPAQLAAAGLDLGSVIQGAAPASLIWRARRDGHGELAVTADLGPASLRFDELGFAKPAGRPAKADVHVALERERITAIDRLTVQGEGIDAEARIVFAAGRPTQALIARLRLGAATDLRADITFPARDGAAWRANLAGASIDAAAQLRRTPPGAPPGPPYVLDAKLDRVVFGDGRLLSGVVLHAENDGRINRALHVAGRAGAGAFAIDVVPVLGGRSLAGTAADAGALLHALDLIGDMKGGEMTLSGRYDDSRADHRLSGSAVITEFRMTRTPGLAALLQAMTFYGLVEMVRGPGLGFARLEAPFSLAGDTLELNDVRAFNSSLGMTARGRVDMASGQCDIVGTIVPAYFFNSLLGNIPLIGRLFSVERGGGLFAANYSMTGDCDDPSVGVNPLSALTPGFLRGIFGLFDNPDAARAPTATPVR